ncbi:MAG: tRNA (adenine(22)-N(1))-methyltransferase [Anaeroplasma sp.]
MNRLDLLASLCKDSNTICDIGCDHAYTVIKALKYYGVKKAIAADISQGPLNQARININSNNLVDKVDIIQSDGFKNINLPFDTAIISGMGGMLINKILEEGYNSILNKKLIISPNSDSYEVRKYLCSNGFYINEEYAIIDQNKYYEIIVFIPGYKEYSDFELKYGPILLIKKSKEYIDYYKSRLNNYLSFYDKINNSIQKNDLVNKINDIKKIIGE